MSYWKLAIVCLLVFSVSANIDTDIELFDDFVREKIELIGAGGGGISSGGSRGGISSGGSRGGISSGGSRGGISSGGSRGGISSGGSRGGSSVGTVGRSTSSAPKATTSSKPSAPISKPSPSSSSSSRVNKPSVSPISKNPSPSTHTKPVTSPSKKPVASPSTKPVTSPSTKPVTSPSTKPIIKPVTKPITTPGTKPITTPGTKPVTTPGTKPVTTPGTKPVTKPITTPGTKPVTTPGTKPATSGSSGSIANDKAYISKLWNLENGAKAGFDKKTGMWTGNAAPEKGGKVDYGPGLKLPYKKGGYTQGEIDKAVTDKITGIESKLRKDVQKLGKNYDNLSETQKKLLVDYSYNTGNAFSVFPKFSKAVVEGDVKGMKAEYERTWVDKNGKKQSLTGRNEWTKSVIDGIGK